MTVTGQHNLFILTGKQIENVEKLFLHLRFAGQTVNVVDQHHVNIPETGTEISKTALFEKQIVVVIENLITGQAPLLKVFRDPYSRFFNPLKMQKAVFYCD